MSGNNTLENAQAVLTIPIGIKGFEQLTDGGLPEGRATYLVGSSGSGKTVFAVEFLYRGITEFGRPGVFVTFGGAQGAGESPGGAGSWDPGPGTWCRFTGAAADLWARERMLFKLRAPRTAVMGW